MDRSRPVRLTPPDASLVERTQSARRHTVRIVERRTPSRAAMLSLLVAVAAAAAAFAAWRWWRPMPTIPMYERTIRDVELNWKCDAGHAFIALGQIGDRTCALCDEPAYPVTTYECRQHGVFEVAVRFAEGSDGGPRVSHHRLKQESWFPAEDPLRCPQCGAPLVRKLADPLEALGRNKKKGGP